MQVARWGNSLAIRIPAALVRQLGLKEGDEVEVRAIDARTLEIARMREREEALARLRAMAVELPPDWKFNRDDANAR